MADKDLLFHNGHRERLKEKLQDGKLTSYEKLELLLTYAIPRREVRALARSLVQRFRNGYLVFTAPLEDLMLCPGVGRSTALLIKLVHELMLVSYKERLEDGVILSDPFVVREYCRQLLCGKTTEEFHVLFLGKDKRLVASEIHSSGSYTSSSVTPEEILRKAALHHALSVILVHNHPMSDNSFSRNDVNATILIEEKLIKAGITVEDHFVVTGNAAVFSLRETPLLNKSSFNE